MTSSQYGYGSLIFQNYHRTIHAPILFHERLMRPIHDQFYCAISEILDYEMRQWDHLNTHLRDLTGASHDLVSLTLHTKIDRVWAA